MKKGYDRACYSVHETLHIYCKSGYDADAAHTAEVLLASGMPYCTSLLHQNDVQNQDRYFADPTFLAMRLESNFDPSDALQAQGAGKLVGKEESYAALTSMTFWLTFMADPKNRKPLNATAMTLPANASSTARSCSVLTVPERLWTTEKAVMLTLA